MNITHKLTALLFLLTAYHLAVAQSFQSIEDINLCKQQKLKSVRISSVKYVDWASSPAGQVAHVDKSTSLRLFDSTGRLVKEYAGLGANYLRNIYYDKDGRIDHEIWYGSKSQVYPRETRPRSDSDYSDIYKKVRYCFNTKGELDSSIVERGNKIIYQYNDSGYLISKLEIEPTGSVINFKVYKYGYGVNWGKILYEVSNNYTQTKTYEYEYKDRVLIRKRIVYDSGNKSTVYYNDKEQETIEELFDKNDRLIAKFQYKYNKYGIEKITSYKLPSYRSWNHPRTNRLRISEEEIYRYDTY